MSNQFPTITEELLKNKACEFGSPGGQSACFIKLSDVVGVKLYYDKAIRDAAYKNQTLAAKHNIGPKTFGIGQLDASIRFISKCNGTQFLVEGQYYYLTEVAKPLKTKSWSAYTVIEQNNLLDKRDKVTKDLLHIFGWFWDDNHFDNVGLLNGEPVCIDFGSMNLIS